MNRMVKRILFFFILFFFIYPIASFGFHSYKLTLLLPEKNALVTEDTLIFKWNCSININKYILILAIKDGSYKREILVFNDNTEIFFTLKNVKKILKKSGTYTWQVKTFQQGEEVLSPIRFFRIKCKNNDKFLPPFDYCHALELQILNRHRSPEFHHFLEQVNSKYSFGDFKSFGLVFQQKKLLFSSLDFLEKIYLLSQTGMGLSVKSRMNLYKNVYFSLYPAVNVSAMWFSTGINRFSSNIISSSCGFDWELMPKRFIAISTRWIPDYRIYYADKNKELKVFDGRGWQLSVEFVISNNIIRRFNLLGMHIDLERLPIRITYNRIKDNYSNQIIKTQMIYFIYII